MQNSFSDAPYHQKVRLIYQKGTKTMKKMLLFTVLGFIVVTLAATVSKCRYCDSPAYGRGCVHSPNKIHRHIETDERCEYCGSKSYGKGCINNPGKVHIHGSGNGKCVYCGLKNVGKGCVFAPDGIHRK